MPAPSAPSGRPAAGPEARPPQPRGTARNGTPPPPPGPGPAVFCCMAAVGWMRALHQVTKVIAPALCRPGRAGAGRVGLQLVRVTRVASVVDGGCDAVRLTYDDSRLGTRHTTPILTDPLLNTTANKQLGSGLGMACSQIDRVRVRTRSGRVGSERSGAGWTAAAAGYRSGRAVERSADSSPTARAGMLFT